MEDAGLRVREMQLSEFEHVLDYFLNAEEVYLRGMGVDVPKLPTAETWRASVRDDFERPDAARELFYLLWLDGETPVGHSHMNNIRFGEEAHMHLHLWRADKRRQGMGTALLRMSVAIYFERFQLARLFCEPYALNPAPNHTLPKVGFEFIKRYETKPSWINFHQPINQWLLTRARWETEMIK